MLSNFHGFSVFLWTSENDWNTIRQPRPQGAPPWLQSQWKEPWGRESHVVMRCYVAVREYLV